MPTRGLSCTGGPQSENQRKEKESQILRPYQRTKKAMKHEGDGWRWYQL